MIPNKKNVRGVIEYSNKLVSVDDSVIYVIDKNTVLSISLTPTLFKFMSTSDDYLYTTRQPNMNKI